MSCNRMGCLRPIVLNKKSCQYHLDILKISARKRYERNRINKACSCGKALEPNYKSCADCRTRATASQMNIYHNNILTGKCPDCGIELNSNEKFRCKQCNTIHIIKTKNRWHKLRQQVLDHYGNECVCCSIAEPKFLEIDHIDNNGATHRKSIGRHIYNWIIKNNFPSDLTLLCANCNRSKGAWGICQHKQEPKQPTTKSSKRCRRERFKIIDHYGSKCICCGEQHWTFLEADHNDGNNQRKLYGNNQLRFIIQSGFPTDIQLLCGNCNKAKGLYGVCPHHTTP